MNEMLTEQPKEEFRLMIIEIIREFVKKPDAELQIEMRNGDAIFLYSKDKCELDLAPAYIKIRTIVQRYHLKGGDLEYVPAENIQVIRLDDIVSVTLINELEELEDE